MLPAEPSCPVVLNCNNMNFRIGILLSRLVNDIKDLPTIKVVQQNTIDDCYITGLLHNPAIDIQLDILPIIGMTIGLSKDLTSISILCKVIFQGVCSRRLSSNRESSRQNQ